MSVLLLLELAGDGAAYEKAVSKLAPSSAGMLQNVMTGFMEKREDTFGVKDT